MPREPGKRRRRSIRLKGYDYAQPGAYFVTICTQYQEPFFGKVEGGRMILNPAGEMVWRWWNELNNKYPTVRADAAVVMPNHFHGIIVIVGQPDGGQPDGGQPDGGQPDGGQPDEGQPDGGQPDGGQPDEGQPDGGQPDEGQPHRAAPTGGDDTDVGATTQGRPDADGDVVFPVPRPETGQPHRAAPTGGDDADVGATLCGRPLLGEIVGWFKTMTTNEYIRGVKELGWPRFPGRVWQRNYYEHIVRNRESLERIRDYIVTNPERWAWDRENPLGAGLDEFESWIYGFPAGEEG